MDIISMDYHFRNHTSDMVPIHFDAVATNYIINNNVVNNQSGGIINSECSRNIHVATPELIDSIVEVDSISVMRKGKFQVAKLLIMKKPKIVSRILTMMQFIPIHVELADNQIEYKYFGISPLFDEINEGYVIPEYLIICHNDELDFKVSVERFSEIGIERGDYQSKNQSKRCQKEQHFRKLLIDNQ